MRRIYPILAVAFAAGLVLLAAMPTADKHALHFQGTMHPYLHFGSFAVLAFLGFRVSRSSRWRIVCLVLVLLLGYATEALESHMDGWPIEERDVLLDTMGVFAGAILSVLADGFRRLPGGNRQ